MLALIDNDVLFKGSCYGLLRDLLAEVSQRAGVLAASRFVLPKKISKSNLRGDRSAVLQRLNEFLEKSEALEPTLEEQEMAADLEVSALRLGLALDVGESQLSTILVKRLVPLLLTGDKRAVVAIDRLLDQDARLLPICGKVRCLEQIFAAAIAGENGNSVRAAVCSEPDIDIALTICFSCRSESVSKESHSEGLHSYIEALRRDATRVLAK